MTGTAPAQDERAGEGHPSRLVVEIGFCSEQGGRPRNEDFAGAEIAQSLGAVIAAVADGVGGASGGRVASELAVRSFIDACVSARPEGMKEAAFRSLRAINRWAHALGRADPALAGMASTFTGVVFARREAHVFHAGDSRAYRLRGDRLEQLTADHRYGGKDCNVLARAVGADHELAIDCVSVDLNRHDRFLLCTDGVHGALEDKAIRQALRRQASPQQTACALVEEALEGRLGDNATALVLDVIDLPKPVFSDMRATFPSDIGAPPKPGDVVDDFRIDETLSDGRYVAVFRASDRKRGDAAMVLKFPKPHEGASGPMLEAFLRECWVASLVRSPFVGEVIDVDAERRTQLYLALPFYEGATLEVRLKQTPPLSLAAGLDIAKKLSRGVAALHRAGVIHRDIKPDNVILQPANAEGVGVKLVDFGVARLKRAKDVKLAAEPGTPSYMAPELFEGETADEETDQYALGVTIYRMFSGRYPYGEIEPFTHPRFRAPTPLSRYRPDLPAWFDNALARAVSVNPKDRYGDVLELMFELEHGAHRASPATPRERSLYQRNPLTFWKCVSFALAFALIVALYRLAHSH